MKTNRDTLVKFSVQGQVSHPIGAELRVDAEGRQFVVPAIGGITYNVSVGDCAFGLAGDHVEPGVSIKHADKPANNALMVFSCLGNKARVVTGDAKGATGYVTGKHGGIEHVIVHFDGETRQLMNLEDKVLVEAYGQGLALEGRDDIFVQSLDPAVLERMGVEERGGKLFVPVVAVVPPYLMGSGTGSGNCYSGDYDIMTADRAEIARLGLDKLRFGDFVLLEDCDNVYGRGFLRGSAAVGVVIHSDCVVTGHGPGVTTVLAARTRVIEPKIDPGANLKRYMDEILERRE